MPSENAGVRSESANSEVNENGAELMEANFVVTSKTGLSLGHIDDVLEEGDTVTLKEDVAKVLLRQGVIKPA